MESDSRAATVVETPGVKDDAPATELGKALAFVVKDMKISVSYRLQFVFQFLQIFFSVAMIYFIGRMLSQSGRVSSLSQYGNDYFAFALVGLAMNSYLKAGLVTITNDIRQTMNQGTLEAMCATPTNYTWLILCSSLWQFVFETVRVLCYFAVAMIIFGMTLGNANWAPALLTFGLTAPIFLMLGVMSCGVLVVVKRGDPINWIFSSLGAILAGTMFPVSIMPAWMRKIAFCFPLTHSLEGARRTLLTGAGFVEISTNLWALAVFVLLLAPLTVFINGSCMRLAKKKGAFSTH